MHVRQGQGQPYPFDRPLTGEHGTGRSGDGRQPWVPALVPPSRGEEHDLGDLLVLAGVLSAAAYTIVARGMGDEPDALTVTAYQFTTATIFILPAVTFLWAMHVETAPSHVAVRFWFAAIFVGVIGYAASFLLYNYAIARVRAAPASIIANLIPVFGLASAVVWLGDSLTAARVLGAILIGLSVTIFTATELAEARNDARANVTPSKA